jgi:TRADD-N domain-containing protein
MPRQVGRADTSAELDLLSDAARVQELVNRASRLVGQFGPLGEPSKVNDVLKALADYSMLDIEDICGAAQRAAGTDPERFIGSYGDLYVAVETADRAVGQVELLEERGRIGDAARVTAVCELIRTSFVDLSSEFRRFDQSSTSILAKAHIDALPLARKPVEQAILQSATVDTTDIAKVSASQLAISNAYYESVLAQAKRSFNAAVVTATVGSLFFLAAIYTASVEKSLAVPVIGALSGSVVEVIAGLNFWLYTRTSAQLDAFHLRLERMQRFLVANSVCQTLRGKTRESALANLINTVVGDDTAAVIGVTPVGPEQ